MFQQFQKTSPLHPLFVHPSDQALSFSTALPERHILYYKSSKIAHPAEIFQTFYRFQPSRYARMKQWRRQIQRDRPNSAKSKLYEGSAPKTRQKRTTPFRPAACGRLVKTRVDAIQFAVYSSLVSGGLVAEVMTMASPSWPYFSSLRGCLVCGDTVLCLYDRRLLLYWMWLSLHALLCKAFFFLVI